MGRTKETPTPRGAMLANVMAQAHIIIPNLPQLSSPKPPTNPVSKSSATRSQAAVNGAKATPGPRVIQSRSSSSSSKKRKSPDADTAGLQVPATTLTLRSSKQNVTTVEEPTSVTAAETETHDLKRQKTDEGLRRTLRHQHEVSDSDHAGGKPSSVGADRKSPRLTRAPRTTARTAQQERAARSQKEAVALLQGPQVKRWVSSAPPTPSAELTPKSPHDDSSLPVTSIAANVQHELPKDGAGLELILSDAEAGDDLTTDSASEREASVSTAATGPLPDDWQTDKSPDPRTIKPHAAQEESVTAINNIGGIGEAAAGGYLAGDPALHPVQLPMPHHMPVGYSLPQAAVSNQLGLTRPALMLSGPHPMYPWAYQVPQPEPVDMATHTFIISTKGQKVKGRPSQIIRRAHHPVARARNVANSYPRKQPFKAQVMFPGYPLEKEEIRDGATLWDICQEYPNHLTQEQLTAFVQKEWSANEICACLQDDARKILTDRPGKDKTMVFQKRLERIKKDLVAKGEYQNLMTGTSLRPDGRPTWVKRGNVRRR